MNIELKLHGIRGILTPCIFDCADNELIEITCDYATEGLVLCVNNNAFSMIKGKFMIYGRDLEEVNTVVIKQLKQDKEIRVWRCDNLVRAIQENEITQELEFYKATIRTMKTQVDELMERLTTAEQSLNKMVTQTTNDSISTVNLIADLNKRLLEIEKIVLDKVAL